MSCSGLFLEIGSQMLAYFGFSWQVQYPQFHKSIWQAANHCAVNPFYSKNYHGCKELNWLVKFWNQLATVASQLHALFTRSKQTTQRLYVLPQSDPTRSHHPGEFSPQREWEDHGWRGGQCVGPVACRCLATESWLLHLPVRTLDNIRLGWATFTLNSINSKCKPKLPFICWFILNRLLTKKLDPYALRCFGFEEYPITGLTALKQELTPNLEGYITEVDNKGEYTKLRCHHTPDWSTDMDFFSYQYD